MKFDEAPNISSWNRESIKFVSQTYKHLPKRVKFVNQSKTKKRKTKFLRL